MMRSENFTRKSDWQGFEVILCVLFLSSSSLDQNKVATRSEEYNMFLGQIRLTHAYEQHEQKKLRLS